jgi:histidinol-phosphate aminotransferase
VGEENVFISNGSDDILNFSFMAFCDKDKGAYFPEISYGFYEVYADLYGVDYKKVPLMEDFSVNPADYFNAGNTVVIANPNAPTGIALDLCDIEKIVSSNPDNVVIIDEAYVDFGAQSAVSLVHRYSNLIVTQTFSKSRSLAGARLGYGIACEDLINDMNTIKYSTNPYNVNRMTMVAGYSALCDNDYYMDNCKQIIENREYTKKSLQDLGFDVLNSSANFLFAKSDKISGENLYLTLKQNGILVRHFSKEKIKDYNRITIGTREQMEALISTIKKILTEA